MESRLRQSGDFSPQRDSDAPNVVVINTCTVTAEADRQARQTIRRIHREHPDAEIVVTGCYSESQPETFQDVEGVSHIVPISEQRRLPEILGADSFVEEEVVVADFSKTRGMLKMQEGCNSFCAYCILPYVRGRSRSIPLSDVCSAARELVAKGRREIVLTGTHIGSYGKDLTPRTRLSHALATLLEAAPKAAFRVSSIEPEALTPDVIRLFRSEDRIHPHFHVPLQSGSDSVLARMNRKQSARMYEERIEELALARENVAIGADVIVGFPGESQEEFQATLDLVEKLPIVYLHVFPFSSRPKTEAAKLPDDVSPREKKERVGLLRKLGFEKRNRFFQTFLGTVQTVLVEQKRDREGLLMGHTPHYLPVRFEGENSLMGEEVGVRLGSIRGESPELLRVVGERVG